MSIEPRYARYLLIHIPVEILTSIVSLLDVKEVYFLLYTFERTLFQRLMNHSVRVLVIPTYMPLRSAILPPLLGKVKLRVLEMTFKFDSPKSSEYGLQWISFLPNTLQMLKASMSTDSIMYEDANLSGEKEKLAISWPSEISSLYMCGSIFCSALSAVSLPNTLTQLEIVTFTPMPLKYHQEAVKWIPPHLTSLTMPSISFTSAKNIETTIKDIVAGYPRGITSLKLYGHRTFSTLGPDFCASLPPHLTYLSFPTEHISLAHLPRTLTCLDCLTMFLSTAEQIALLPPHMLHLNVSIAENSEYADVMAFCQALPRSLRRLRIHIPQRISHLLDRSCLLHLPTGLHTFSSNAKLCVDFGATLPRGLRSLTLNIQESSNFVDFCRFLPPNLTIFSAPYIPPLTESMFISLLKELPSTILRFLISAVASDEALKHLPPNLTVLGAFSLEGITENMFQYLPPTVTSLTVPRDFKWSQANWFEKIPSHIQDIMICSDGEKLKQYRFKQFLESISAPKDEKN